MDTKIARLITKANLDIDHPLFDFRSNEAKKKITWIYRYLKPYVLKGCRLLDIGCGTGKYTFACEKIGAKAEGIDCSKEAIKYARQIKEEIKSNCKFTVGDYTKTPFRKNYFDIAIFPKNIVECSYYEMDSLTLEVKRILKKGSRFVVLMEDGLESVLNRNVYHGPKYDANTGLHNETILLQNRKRLPYPTYFWTVAFAKYLISRYLHLEEEKKIKGGFYLLIFKK